MIKLKYKILFLIFILAILFNKIEAQCNQQYNWTSWQNFSGTAATGIINNNGQTIKVSMNSNFTFGSSPGLYNYPVFNNFNGSIPNATVPQTTWGGPGGITTLCFDQAVKNPVLLFSSLGNAGLPVTLQFSRPYWVIYNAGGMTFNNDTSITGKEGFTVLLFPGDVTCLSIYSGEQENYTDLTWGINTLLFPVNITGNPEHCDSVTLTASGGLVYSWNGGNAPIGPTNTFYTSGTYFVNARDGNGCSVIAGKTITVHHAALLTVNKTVCEGEAVEGHTAQGTYIDKFTSVNGCDSIRTLILVVNHISHSTINGSVCEGDTLAGHTAPGTYVETFKGINGCDSIRTLHLELVKKANPYLGQEQILCTGDSISLYPGQFDSYMWQNGSAQDHFVVKQGGTYKVSVKNSCGPGDAQTTVTEMNCIIHAPNAFSPNGDGVNDNWMIPVLSVYPACKVEVFNRYGQRVFYSEGYNKPWNGTFNGKPLSFGTYYWMITLIPGKPPVHGSVTIVF